MYHELRKRGTSKPLAGFRPRRILMLQFPPRAAADVVRVNATHQLAWVRLCDVTRLRNAKPLFCHTSIRPAARRWPPISACSTSRCCGRGVDERESNAYVRIFPGITVVPEHA